MKVEKLYNPRIKSVKLHEDLTRIPETAKLILRPDRRPLRKSTPLYSLFRGKSFQVERGIFKNKTIYQNGPEYPPALLEG